MSTATKLAKMPLKFAANLSFMFKEHASLLDRYAAAKKAGFRAVECAFPYEFSIEQVVKAKTESGLQQVLINSWPGDLSKEDRGLAAIPGRQEEFKTTLETSIEYAKALDCTRLHIMSGKAMPLLKDAAMGKVFEDNLKLAADRLEKEGIVGLIEPINHYSVPHYHMNNFDEAVRLIKKINSSSLKLQMDLFHLQHLNGNLTHRIKDMFPYVGHIQIAQVPDRHEPNTAGEINYNYVFDVLTQLDYQGWIGCEYTPKGDTVDGLSWIKEYDVEL